jgi:hypothetical protein
MNTVVCHVVYLRLGISSLRATNGRCIEWSLHRHQTATTYSCVHPSRACARLIENQEHRALTSTAPCTHSARTHMHPRTPTQDPPTSE